MSGRDVTLEPHTEIGTVTAANIVPSTQVNNEADLDEKEKVPCTSPQVESADLHGKFQQGRGDLESILQMFDLPGIDEWEPQTQQEGKDLICEYACIFSQNDLDLSKTSVVKHSIKVNDPKLFKEHY